MLQIVGEGHCCPWGWWRRRRSPWAPQPERLQVLPARSSQRKGKGSPTVEVRRGDDAEGEPLGGWCRVLSAPWVRHLSRLYKDKFRGNKNARFLKGERFEGGVRRVFKVGRPILILIFNSREKEHTRTAARLSRSGGGA